MTRTIRPSTSTQGNVSSEVGGSSHSCGQWPTQRGWDCHEESKKDGIDDCYTSARGCTATLGNFAKATFDAISKTYSYLTPDLWKEMVFTKSPYQEFTDHLVKTHTRVSVQRTQAPAVATT
ncbi:PREDICTED: 40S ribosomal protein S2-like [Odobenus rosmarus divergens]|uniref:40S ribosomal protein S2-like n=1 Tax=Odobenus rosmarus divergens TaxID=9708 RepID=A0A9B0M5S9_ODORO